MGVSDQRHVPAALLPGNIPLTLCTVDWLGQRAGLERRVKYHPHPTLGFDHRTVQHIIPHLVKNLPALY